MTIRGRVSEGSLGLPMPLTPPWDTLVVNPTAWPGLQEMLWVSLADVTVANTTTETSLVTATGNGNLTLPPYLLRSGSVLKGEASGIYTSAAAATTFRFRLKLGGVTMIQSALVTIPASQSNQPWVMKFAATVRDSGAAALFPGHFWGIYYGSSVVNWATRAAQTMNVDAGGLVDLTIQISAASADRSITCEHLNVTLGL